MEMHSKGFKPIKTFMVSIQKYFINKYPLGAYHKKLTKKKNPNNVWLHWLGVEVFFVLIHKQNKNKTSCQAKVTST